MFGTGWKSFTSIRQFCPLCSRQPYCCWLRLHLDDSRFQKPVHKPCWCHHHWPYLNGSDHRCFRPHLRQRNGIVEMSQLAERVLVPTEHLTQQGAPLRYLGMLSFSMETMVCAPSQILTPIFGRSVHFQNGSMHTKLSANTKMNSI